MALVLRLQCLSRPFARHAFQAGNCQFLSTYWQCHKGFLRGCASDAANDAGLIFDRGIEREGRRLMLSSRLSMKIVTAHLKN